MAPAIRRDRSEKKVRKKGGNNNKDNDGCDSKISQTSTRQRKPKKATTKRSNNSGKKENKKKKYDHDKPSTEEQKNNYAAFLRELYNLGIQGVLNQYTTGLKAFVPEGISKSAFEKNMDKNRYKDVICVDSTRVILNDGEKCDYIHANHINDPYLVNKFICTQGPMAGTIVDFWRMILQEGVENIIMLCETVEQGKEKCQQYWPLGTGSALEFSGIAIKTLDVDSKTDSATIISTLEVAKGSDRLIVKHHQWRTWPDRSVPQSVMAPFRLLKVARNSSAPTVVHCSAGVGRTGTVVALEICLQRLLAGKSLCVMTAVQELRAMRMHCVQTDLQLVFINKCLTAFAASRQLITGDLASKQDKFDADYAKLIADRLQPENDVGYTPLVPVCGFAPQTAVPAGPGPPGGGGGGFFLPMNMSPSNPPPAMSQNDPNKEETI
uniref:Protein-tyrosine phosphatase n=1 Tax=Panagrellus redivivus TaxID=6233 RepID=A0A7E4W4A6_PANRE